MNKTDSYSDLLDYEQDDDDEEVVQETVKPAPVEAIAKPKPQPSVVMNKQGSASQRQAWKRKHVDIEDCPARVKTQKVSISNKQVVTPVQMKDSKLILLKVLPSSLCNQNKLKQQMTRFGELSSVKVFPSDNKAIISYLTKSGANRAFTSNLPIFNNSSIQVFRIQVSEFKATSLFETIL